jgi:uncharacterized protein (TIGR03437 family)
MKASRILTIFLIFQLLSLAQNIDVGSGSPSDGIRLEFVQAYYRGMFSGMVSMPPAGNVGKFGTNGLRQEFDDSKGSGPRLALIKPDVNVGGSESIPGVIQVWALLYSYYNSVGVTTAGMPTMDTANCPPNAGNCTWQTFDKNYALFAYATAIANGQNFTTRDPFFTNWRNNGGVNTFGPATSAEIAFTSTSGNATIQYFSGGAIFNNTSGALSGRVLTVREPIFSVYAANNSAAGFLGLPTTEEQVLANNRRRQSFQGGSIEYEPGSGAVLRLPVATVTVAGVTSPVRMNLNETLNLEATLRAADSSLLSDRAVVWSSSNSRVVTVQSNGYKATVRAVGGGIATVVASSEGKASQAITISVTAPCCQVGEGAPSTAISQAFQDAITRNRLTPRLPGPFPVRRSGNGFYQEVIEAVSGVRVVVAMSDRSPAAYVVAGAILSRWEDLGGPGGAFGYPSSDPTAQGRQTFEKGALAGSPVRVVSEPILSRWAALGFETGTLGPPMAEAAPFFSVASTSGASQVFRNGILYGLQSGPNTGRTPYTTGLIQSKHLALGGVAGRFGAPLTDEYGIAGRRRQDFEGGNFEYAPGDAEAAANANPRKPALSAEPGTVTAGARVRILLGGFLENARLRISVTGQPDFHITTPNGAWTWEMIVPSAAASGAVTVRAVDTATGESAQAAFSVRAIADARLRLRKTRGDEQVGAPGAMLPLAFRVVVEDEFGSPMAGVSVRFSATPGATLSNYTGTTNSTGEVETYMRLPAAESVALATAEAFRQVVTFAARAAPVQLSGVPRFASTGDPLLAAVASIVRYHQNRAELTSAGGLADPSTLGAFLKGYCSFDSQGQQICDGYLRLQDAAGKPAEMLNLWRAGGFVGGNLDVRIEERSMDSVRTLLSQGAPLLVTVSLEGGGAHAVVATGVRSDGSVPIMDPHATAPRGTLDDYLKGSVILGVARLLPRAPTAGGFLAHAQGASVSVASPAGLCGPVLGAGVSGAAPVEFVACEGSQFYYQLDVTASGAFRGALTDLGSPVAVAEFAGRDAAAFRVARPGTQWELSPMDTAFSASTVVNGASYSPDIAPGGLIAIFGSGLARQGGRTAVEVDGVTAQVLAAGSFQVNAQLPLGLAPGVHTLTLRSPFGEHEAAVTVQEVAPALFQSQGQQGAILNQDGSANGPHNPARRGEAVVAFGTGFGAVIRDGRLDIVTQPVEAFLGEVEVPVLFAGLAPGFAGLYQLNLRVPTDIPPGLKSLLSVRQGGVASNRVEAAIQ